MCGDCYLKEEYHMTLRVLAIMVERLQQLTGSSEVEISHLAINDQPDLQAWLNGSGSISLTTSR